MNRRSLSLRAAAVAFLLSTAVSAAPRVAVTSSPLRFEENRGQSDARVRFLARGGGGALFLRQRAIVAGGVTIDLLGARDAALAGEQPLASVSNYFIGNDPSRWRSNVPNFGAVRYRSVYRGIDLLFYGNEGRLEYDWVVAPGADPHAIRFRVRGAQTLRIDRDGDLVIDDMRMQRPVVRQDGVVVRGDFALSRGGVVTFRLGEYDRTRSLVIDPVLSFSTYLGGTGLETPNGCAVDGAGNVYITGSTTSTDFPTASPYQSTNGSTSGFTDVFVSKFSASGSQLLYSTYIGGSSDDVGASIAVDSGGNAYITGYTTSTNYPTKNPIQSSQVTNGFADAFVTKLTSAGSALTYSTYLGGSSSENADAIAVDASGNAYVTGFTLSANFPTTAGVVRTTAGSFQDAFVTKVNAAGSAYSYSTYLGGTNAQNRGSGVAVDSSGNAYVTGETSATNFPATASAYQKTFQGGSFSSQGDGFVVKLNPTATAFVYATYLGGTDDESPKDIAIDSSGNAYVTGIVISTNYPVTAGVIQSSHATGAFLDAFVTKLNTTGSALVYSTYLGGTGTDYGWGIAVDSSGQAVVGGYTTSTNFPTASPIQSMNAGSTDAWIGKLNVTGTAFIYSTYLGGSSSDTGADADIDSSGNAYIVGQTLSTNFPTQSPYQSTNHGGSGDAFVAKIVDPTSLATPTGVTATASGTTQVNVSWNAVSGATGYDVYRSTSGPSSYSLRASVGAVTNYSDTGVSNGSAYLYEVRATGSGSPSALSAPDAATVIAFTDEPLNAGTIIKAVHITQLRTAINALRAAAGLSASTFTDTSLTGVMVKAVHITELRTALNSARSTIGLSAVGYTYSPATGTIIHAVDVQELRNGVK